MDAEALYLQAMNDIQAGRHEEAQGLLAQVLQANPRNELAWLALALIVPEMDQAIECLNRVLALNPHHEQALKYLDLAHQEKGRDETAAAPESSTPTDEGASGEDAPTMAVEPSDADLGRLPRLGKYLLGAGVVTVAQIEAGLTAQRKAAAAGKLKRLGEILVEQGVITSKELDAAVHEQFQRFNSLFWD
jgi:tetratricopeptide (TPR) repeat protein